MNAPRGLGIIALLLVVTMALGLGSVWLNIERMDVAYDLRNMEKRLQASTELVSKLEVERDNLLSPYQLRRMADGLGLVPAETGQIRSMN